MVRTQLSLLSIAAAVSVAGCTVGENYRRPDIAAPAAFRGAVRDAAADSASLADQKWFDVFKDEPLQELIRTALVRNHDARDAVVRVEAARAALGITARISIQPSTPLRTWRRCAAPQPGRWPARGSRPDENVRHGRNQSAVVRAGCLGTPASRNRGARADLLAAEYNRKAVMTTLVSDVASAYFNLLDLDMELAIAEAHARRRVDSLELIRNRERGGLGTLLDVRQGSNWSTVRSR